MSGLEKPALEFITLEDIRGTHERIKQYIVRTPVVTNEYFDQLVSERVGRPVKVHFKAELLQKTGSFKTRGAINAVMKEKREREGKLQGIVTQSSGNHGASASYAAKHLGVKCVVVVPDFSTDSKVANMVQNGGEVIKVAPRPEVL